MTALLFNRNNLPTTIPIPTHGWNMNSDNDLYAGSPVSLTPKRDFLSSTYYSSAYGYGGWDGLNCDGTSSIVTKSALNSSFLSGSTLAKAISLWIYPTSAQTCPILSQISGANFEVGLDNSSGFKFYFKAVSSTTLFSTTTLSASTWYHVVFILDKTNTKKLIYINGVLDASNSYTGTITGTSNRYARIFGTASTSSTNAAPYLNAYVSDFYLWNDTAAQLTPQQVQELYYNKYRNSYPFISTSNLGRAISHYFNFTNNNFDVITGRSTTVTNITRDAAYGKIGSGCLFNGTDSKIYWSIPLSVTFSYYDTNRSCSLWAYPTSNIQSGTIKSFGNDGMWSIGIEYVSNTTFKFVLKTVVHTTETTIRSSTYNSDSWYHVCGSLDVINLKAYLFVNGVSDGDSSDILTDNGYTYLTGISGSDYFGCSTGLTNFYKGYIDEVGMWNRSLTEQDAKELYWGGEGNTYPFKK